MQHTVFAAFFVIEDELHGDACATGPLSVGHISAVTDQIARVRLGAIKGGHGVTGRRLASISVV